MLIKYEWRMKRVYSTFVCDSLICTLSKSYPLKWDYVTVAEQQHSDHQ